MRSSQATARSDALRSPSPKPEFRLHAREAAKPAGAPRTILLRACRPRQWVKNLLVVLAPAAAGVLTRTHVAAELTGAFVAFCMLASATYLVNDVRDREEDRRHPRKRHRPIAAGQLAPRRALNAAAALAFAGLTLATAIRPALALIGLAYLALTFSYSVLWRHVVIADLVVVAGGFVLRAAAGGVAVGVPLSRSFLVVSTACALFLVTGKRYADLSDRAARSSRATLERYSRPLLRWVLIGAGLVGCLAYARWAFSRPQLSPWVELSLLPFVLWLGRYAAMLRVGAGQVPEDLILRDPPLLALSAVWTLLFVAGLYGTG